MQKIEKKVEKTKKKQEIWKTQKIEIQKKKIIKEMQKILQKKNLEMQEI